MAIVANRVTTTNDLDLEDRLVAINRVAKVTKGGCTFTSATIVVAGNEDGVVGYGMGRTSEMPVAIAKDVEAARKNLIRVPIHNGTIPHEQIGRFGGTYILLHPTSADPGVTARGIMRTVLDSVSITDVLAKSQDSTSPHGLIKTTIAALAELRSLSMVTQSRGIPVEHVPKG